MGMKDENSSVLIESVKKNVIEAEKVEIKMETLQKKMEDLKNQEGKIDTEISECQKTIKVLLGGNRVIRSKTNTVSSQKRSVGRPRKTDETIVMKKMTLAEAVRKVMTSSKEPMKVKDIAQEVLNIGYRTKIKNSTYFASSVNKILRDDKEMKKVSHGVFTFAPRKVKSKTSKKKSA